MKLSDLEGETPWDIPPEKMLNLKDLLLRMNELEAAYGKPLIVSSGYRTIKKQTEIYCRINYDRKLLGKDPVPIPMFSQHMEGNACDIHCPPPSMDLKIWVKLHEDLIKKIGLWMESFDYTPTWIHFQRVPPKSGALYFRPY